MDQSEMKVVQDGSGAQPRVLFVRSGWSMDPDGLASAQRFVDDQTDAFASVWDAIVTQALEAKGTGQSFDLEAEIAKTGIIVDSIPLYQGTAFGYIHLREKQAWHKRILRRAFQLLPKRLRKSGHSSTTVL